MYGQYSDSSEEDDGSLSRSNVSSRQQTKNVHSEMAASQTAVLTKKDPKSSSPAAEDDDVKVKAAVIIGGDERIPSVGRGANEIGSATGGAQSNRNPQHTSITNYSQEQGERGRISSTEEQLRHQKISERKKSANLKHTSARRSISDSPNEAEHKIGAYGNASARDDDAPGDWIGLEREKERADDQQDHFSFTCHLFPRLSESNLQFHDLYWNRDSETKVVILRKRRVCVNKLVKSMVLRLPDSHQNQRTDHFRADISLLDRRPFARREIVSNILSVWIPAVTGEGPARIFRKVSPSASVLVRSNYPQKEVALLIQLHHRPPSTSASTLIGRVQLDLLDEKGKLILHSRLNSHTLAGGYRFGFETADVSPRGQLQTDCLPDVLICEEQWVGMLAIYRQLLCERIAEDGDVFSDRPTWIVDPIVATFPPLLDSDAEAVQLLLGLIQKYDIFNQKELTPQEASRRFRFLYLQFMLPITALADSGKWRSQLKAFLKGTTSEEPNPVGAFGTEACAQLDVSEYAIGLWRGHAID